jgi:uncharacterized protein (PEP-CTERM system associated)
VSRTVSAVLSALVVTTAGTGTVLASDWTITPLLAITETYTDNVNLANDDEERNSDLISEISPGIRIRGSGGRASLNLDFAHNQLFFKNTDQDQSTQDLNAAGQLEIWDRVAFIDATASISRQVTDNRDATTNTAAGQTRNRSDVRTFEVSPYLLHHFGSYVETETRYRYSDVRISDDAAADTRTFEESFVANSGRQFQRLRWSLAARRSKEIHDDNSPSPKSLTVDNDYQFVVVRQFSLLGGVGYEDIDDGSLINRPKGFTWNAGVAVNPSRRTSARATYGKRFDDDNFSFEATHQLSSRTRMRAVYTDSLQTTQRLTARNLNFIGTDINGNLIDLNTGQPFNPATDAFSVQTETFRQRRFLATVSGSRQRNRFNLSAFWEERKTDRTGRDDTVIGATVNAARDLTRRTVGDVSLTYRNTEFEGGIDRTDHLYSVTGKLTYEIFRNTSAVLSLSRTQRSSDVDVNDLTENAAVLGLRKEF